MREDIPDLTVEELLEEPDDREYGLTEDELDEMREENQDLWRMVQYTAIAMGLNWLLMNDHITFREYVEYIDHVEAQANEEGVSLP